MAECWVNDIPETFDFRQETWGALLDGVDRRLGAEGRVVTAVRFDGVDQPSFRHPELAPLALAGLARIDIDAEGAVALFHAAVDAASASLPSLVDGVAATAQALRAGAPSASGDLLALVTALQSLIALTIATGTAAEVSFGANPAADAAVRAACRRLEQALASIVTSQDSGDPRAIAAALETRLAPAVAGWSDVLNPIRMRAAA